MTNIDEYISTVIPCPDSEDEDKSDDEDPDDEDQDDDTDDQEDEEQEAGEQDEELSDVKITSKVIKRNKGVLIEHLQNYIQYSINTFLKCLNKESYAVLTRNRVKLFLNIWLNLDWEMLAVGVVNMKLRKSGNLKRKKAPEEQLSVPKGTTVEHYLQLISDTMDIMDEFPEMKGYFIIMDSAPIHVPEMIESIIMQQGYT
ncbi:hypothetical protein BDF21DRAFT_468170 [Thamnidium elegans]|nr:hypothetical protein BDF21DRAFT_468170 [Thamnidium elegans]